MSKEILYSIVVPVYNVEKYLQECIDSLRLQTYTNIEIILVDDGSPDKCGEICDKNAELDNRIKVIHKENGGVSAARKSGVEAACGEYVLFVDSDDWISKDCVEKINKVILDNGQPDIVNYASYTVTAQGKKRTASSVPEGYYSQTEKRKKIFPFLIQNENAEYYAPSICEKAFRRNLIMHNMISEQGAVIGEDMASTAPAIYYAKSLYVLDECLYYYRFNETSVTKSRKPFPWSCAKVLAQHLDNKMDLSDADFQMQVYRYVVHMLFITAASRFYANNGVLKTMQDIKQNLSDEFYKKAISKCRFRTFSKGWFAHIALKYRLWWLIWLYNKAM